MQGPRSLSVINEAKRCTECAAHLPLGPRPLVRGSRASRLLIIGQAPGTVAHHSSLSWNDRSGDRLREWLGLSREVFYDDQLVALMPMGFCYPGQTRGGDAPPRIECAPLWHDRIRRAMVDIRLTVYVGSYAYAYYLADRFASITEAVQRFEKLLPSAIALPHPSWRNNRWLKQNRWFERDVLPALRERVRVALAARRAEAERFRSNPSRERKPEDLHVRSETSRKTTRPSRRVTV